SPRHGEHQGANGSLLLMTEIANEPEYQCSQRHQAGDDTRKRVLAPKAILGASTDNLDLTFIGAFNHPHGSCSKHQSKHWATSFWQDVPDHRSAFSIIISVQTQTSGLSADSRLQVTATPWFQ